MAIAGRRWITNVAPWSCIATSTGRSFGVRCELTSASRAPISFPESCRPPRPAADRLRNYDLTCVGHRLIIKLRPPHGVRSSGTSVNAFEAISKERRRAA